LYISPIPPDVIAIDDALELPARAGGGADQWLRVKEVRRR